MKQREPRQKVMIKARMRVGTTWRDACILDLSSRGLMIVANEPPPERAYLELRRGRHVIVARVVWSRDRRCGLQTQDLLPTAAIIAEPDQSAARSIAPDAERRIAPTPRPVRVEKHEHSRWRGRAWEFASVAVVGGAFATFLFSAVTAALDQPLAVVTTVLAAK